ncbi:MAG: hypothetical protein LBK74_06120 [Treponema sp.]|nr:hypothetical protein [Treponema sp.]
MNLPGGFAVFRRARFFRAGFPRAGERGFRPGNPPDGRCYRGIGDGSSLSLRIDPGAGGRSSAVVSGKPYTFALPQWTVSRILRDIRQTGNP